MPRSTPPTDDKLILSYRIGEETRRFEFASGRPIIGRGRDCDVHIADPSISRHHASLGRIGRAWFLKDLGSSNGTFVGERRIAFHRLSSGERVQFGGVKGSIRIESSTPEPAPAPAPAPADAPGVLGTHTIQAQNFDGLISSLLQRSDLDAPAPETGTTGAATPRSAASEDSSESTPGAAWIISIVREATNSLLAHDALNPILERVMDLVFEHLPAARGAILLYDREMESLVPRVQRTSARRDRSGQYDPEERIRISHHISEAATKSKQAILVKEVDSDERFREVQSIAEMNIYSAVCAPLYHEGRVGGLIYADRTETSETFTQTHLEVLSILASLSAAAVERARLRERLDREREVRTRLARYHSPAVIERVLRTDDLLEHGMLAEERVVSVLFADIVGFTRLSETLSALETTALLNEVFERLTDAVFRENGTLDKFIGDNVMVFFGAPLDQPDHAARAVRTAMAMQCSLGEFNTSRPGEVPLAMRVGINTGAVIVGDIGASQRKDYTVIGDTVNVASRLESSVCVAGQVVIGETTFELVQADFHCVALDPVVVRNREECVRPYLVLPGEPCPE